MPMRKSLVATSGFALSLILLLTGAVTAQTVEGELSPTLAQIKRSKTVRLGYRETRPMQSVGYRQVLEYLEGRLPKDELAPAIDRATKVFARRQRTWLRDRPVEWIDPSG